MKEITLNDFINQAMAQAENANDTVVTFGVMSGMTVPYRFTVQLRRADGSRYDIHIKE